MKRVAVVVAILLLSPVGAVALDDGSLDNGEHLVYANDSTSLVYATDNGTQWQNDSFVNIAGVEVIENESSTFIYVSEAEGGMGTTILDSDGNFIYAHNYSHGEYQSQYIPLNNTHYINNTYGNGVHIESIWSSESNQILNRTYSTSIKSTDEIIAIIGNESGTNYASIYDRDSNTITNYTFTNRTDHLAADNNTSIVVTQGSNLFGAHEKVYKIENGTKHLIEDNRTKSAYHIYPISNDRYFMVEGDNISVYDNGSLEVQSNTSVELDTSDSYGIEDGTIYGYTSTNNTIVTVNHTTGEVSNLTQPDIQAFYTSVDSYEGTGTVQNDTNNTTTPSPNVGEMSVNIFGLPDIFGNIEGVPFYLIGAALTVIGVVIMFYYDEKLSTVEYIE